MLSFFSRRETHLTYWINRLTLLFCMKSSVNERGLSRGAVPEARVVRLGPERLCRSESLTREVYDFGQARAGR
jgi:hypothetical protein